MDRADLDELASEIVTSSLTKGADLRHPEYWEVVMGLLLIGRFDSTRALLKLHSEADTVPFFEADLLLRSIPVYTVRSLFIVIFFCFVLSTLDKLLLKIERGSCYV